MPIYNNMSSTDDPTVQAIDNKSSDNSSTSSDSSPTTNDWVGFAKSVLQNIAFIVLLSLLFAGTIFFSRSETKDLDMYFPTDPAAYFGGSKTQSGGGSKDKCRPSRFTVPNFNGSMGKIDYLKKIGLGGDLQGWPYSMYSEAGQMEGSFGSWLAETIAKTFMFSRAGWKSIYSYFYGWSDQVMILLSPFILLAGFVIAFISGFVAVYNGAFNSTNEWSLIWSVIILPLAILFLTLPYIQKFLLLIIVMFAPVMINKEAVFEIARCNQNTVGMLFAALTVGSTFQYLVPAISTSALIAWILMLIKILVEQF